MKCLKWSHKWTKWGEPYSLDKAGIYWYQARRCFHCGVIETREICGLSIRTRTPKIEGVT